MKTLGITGGSGSGKSTLAMALADKYRDDTTFLSMDDFFKRSTNAERDAQGVVNWDSPVSVDFHAFYESMVALQEGKAITVQTKSKFYYPEFDYDNYAKIQVELRPKKYLLVEGFMLLYDKRIRDLIDLKVYLDIPIHLSLRRRDNDKHTPSEEYISKYLLPNQVKNIESNRCFVDVIVDTDRNNTEQTFSLVDAMFKKLRA
jgi:uridine kinase